MSPQHLLKVLAFAAVFFCGMSAARAQEGLAPGGGDAAPPASASVSPVVAADVEAMLVAGEYDKALAGAKSLLDGASDEAVKTEAQRLMADALRKKGQWKEARAGYLKVCGRYAKTSDDYLKCDTIAEILRLSPTGTFRPALQEGTAAGGNLPTLADDAHLTDALRYQAGVLAKKVLLRVSALRRARTPQEIVTLLADILEGFRQARVLDPSMATKDERETAVLAGTRLQELADTMVPQLRAKAVKIREKRQRPWSYTNVEKEDIQKCGALVRECASVEGQFQGLLGKVGGSGEWAEGDTIRSQSADRAATYQSFGDDFIILPYNTSWW